MLTPTLSLGGGVLTRQMARTLLQGSEKESPTTNVVSCSPFPLSLMVAQDLLRRTCAVLTAARYFC